MSILTKLKSFFQASKEYADKKLEESNKPKEEPQSLIPQPKGDLIGQCSLCTLAIGSEDKIRELQGNLVHRRCLKKSKKMVAFEIPDAPF